MINRLAERSSLVPDAPLLDEGLLPWTDGLRQRWQTIRDELLALLARRSAVPPLRKVSPDHARIAADERWKSLFLVGYGYRIAGNCALAPQTARLVGAIPHLNSAFFSLLEPGCRIPRHTGVTKGLLTWHLGLRVPADRAGCRMALADRTLHWGEGESFLFDDTYPHEVWNDTPDMRAILLVQVRRPMGLPHSMLPDLFLWGIRRSAFVRDAAKNLEQWDIQQARSSAG